MSKLPAKIGGSRERQTKEFDQGASSKAQFLRTLFKDRLNVSKLPARRIGRSRERQTKEFDQAGSELGSTVFKNRKDSIRTVSLPRIKARKGMENIIMKNFN